MQRKLTFSLLQPEVEFLTSRSSGPGGQNVNKVNSKVTLKFPVSHSSILSDEEKAILFNKLSRQMTKEGALILSSQNKRSQLQNKEAAIERFENLLTRAFEKKKARKATKPSKQSVHARIKKKKAHSEKKKWRQKPI